MIRRGLLLVLVSVMVGCASKPQAYSTGYNTYAVFGETEFDMTGLMQELHAAAAEQCNRTAQNYVVTNTQIGPGGVGAFSSKRAVQLSFSCQ